jgi:hypothetical protein
VQDKTFIHCDKAIPSYLALIPLVYLRYKYPQAWKHAEDVENFLLRSLLAGAFSGTPDQLIDDCVARINKIEKFDIEQMFEVIRSKGRSLELTEDRLWNMGYGSESIHLLFNLWYRQFDYTPAYKSNIPQVDHVFPQSILKKVKVPNQTGKLNIMKYREEQRNQLANCMLLTQEENGAGGKWDRPPEQWFADKKDAYLEMHLIPKDKALWEIEQFEEFITKRKELIINKFSYLLVQPSIKVKSAIPPFAQG